MKNLFLLPTDKSSYLYKDMEVLFYNKDFVNIPMLRKNHHIYITSDEEIKEGDYYITPNNTVLKALGPMLINVEDYKKIILTTDPESIEDGVQAIDDKFLEWFVKNPSCEEVEIGEGTRYEDEWIDNEDGGEIYQHQYCCYKIIIPKEEPKQNTKDEVNKFFVDLVCNKQETLEEALDRKYPLTTLQHLQLNTAIRTGFEEGASWQSEKMYSAEEVINIIKEFDKDFYSGIVQRHGGTNKWFEKFKKK